MRVLFFQGQNKSPVIRFIESLSIPDRARVLASLKSIEQLGVRSPRVQFRQIQGKLWEIKIKTQNAAYRIFYVLLAKELMVLLHGYKKQSQKAPRKELSIALKRLQEVLEYEKDYVR